MMSLYLKTEVESLLFVKKGMVLGVEGTGKRQHQQPNPLEISYCDFIHSFHICELKDLKKTPIPNFGIAAQ